MIEPDKYSLVTCHKITSHYILKSSFAKSIAHLKNDLIRHHGNQRESLKPATAAADGRPLTGGISLFPLAFSSLARRLAHQVAMTSLLFLERPFYLSGYLGPYSERRT